MLVGLMTIIIWFDENQLQLSTQQVCQQFPSTLYPASSLPQHFPLATLLVMLMMIFKREPGEVDGQISLGRD